VNCRRGGASAAFDRLNKYFTISNMPVVPSQYWNATHGLTPEEVKTDLEGMQIMRTLAATWRGCSGASKPPRDRCRSRSRDAGVDELHPVDGGSPRRQRPPRVDQQEPLCRASGTGVRIPLSLLAW